MKTLSTLLIGMLLAAPLYADNTVVKVKGVELPGIPIRLTDPPKKEKEKEAKRPERPAVVASGASTHKQGRMTPQRPIDLEVIPGVNDLIRISRGYLNRIVTPYERPKLLTTNPIDVQYEQNVVYVTTNSEKPVGIYITPADVEGSEAISLTLIPVAIPPREIRLRLSETTTALSNPRARKWETSQEYISVFKGMFRQLALGEVPAGYALSKNVSGSWTCQQSGLRAELGQALDGHHVRILVLLARNETSARLEVDLAQCYKDGVLAAATWPHAILEPGAETELYLALRKETRAKKRRSRPVLTKGEQPSPR